MLNEAPFWMALAHLPKWKIEKINNLIIDILINKNITFSEFFELDQNEWGTLFNLNDNEIVQINQLRTELPNLSFIAESLYEQGFEVVPFNSPDYSEILKENLKLKYTPSILYLKGNKKLLNEECVAVVGSRNAGEISLRFTENLSIYLSKNFKVVVSGFAKGVDKMALDSSIKNNGNSIIVLPQGILTFSTGFKKYYPQLVEGQLLVLSTFPPNVPWSVGLAMARNMYIYGLAKEIYVAESGKDGGTWNGAINGLKKGRKVYVRKPGENEINANEMLIEKGAIPVDFNGNIISESEEKLFKVAESKAKYFEKNKNQTELF
jgi:DNA processing protein